MINKYYPSYKFSIAASLILAICLVFVLIFQTSAASQPKVPKTPPEHSSLKQRIDFRKKEFKVKLKQERSSELKSQCANAQSKLGQLNSTSGALLDKYSSTYDKVDGIVLVNIGQLKIAGQDTSSLAAHEKLLATKISDFSDLSRNYVQALNDGVSMNCASDPAGFQAVLDAIRLYYKAIIYRADDIASLSTNNIQPDLESYLDKVKAGE